MKLFARHQNNESMNDSEVDKYAKLQKHFFGRNSSSRPSLRRVSTASSSPIENTLNLLRGNPEGKQRYIAALKAHFANGISNEEPRKKKKTKKNPTPPPLTDSEQAELFREAESRAKIRYEDLV
jgi:hypothetical protein